MHLSLVEECRSRVEQALARLGREVPIDARGEMKLQAALGASLLFTKGPIPAAMQACTAALRLAESLGDTEHQLRALWEIWVHRTNTGEHAAALAVAQQFYTLALEHADPATLPIADRMIGMSHHYLGDQTNAWRHIDRMTRADVDAQRRSPLIRFWFDQVVAGRVVLARILWLQGFADQAWRTVQSAVGEAEALADPATLCYALSHGGCLLALWVGDLAAAERYAEMLLDLSRKRYPTAGPQSQERTIRWFGRRRRALGGDRFADRNLQAAWRRAARLPGRRYYPHRQRSPPDPAR
jgi:hypothetical protein